MIGFDLDGIFIADSNFDKRLSLTEFLDRREQLPRTIFVPKGKYAIVTGRDWSDREYTNRWIEKNLKENPPIKVYHECRHHSKAKEYKAKVINENGLTVFVESDRMQVEYLQRHCPNCRVFHFEGLIHEMLSSL